MDIYRILHPKITEFEFLKNVWLSTFQENNRFEILHLILC